jgi:hypothetical protein
MTIYHPGIPTRPRFEDFLLAANVESTISHEIPLGLDFGRFLGLNPASSDHYQKTNKSLVNMSKSRNLQKVLIDAEEKRLRLEELKQSGTY